MSCFILVAGVTIDFVSVRRFESYRFLYYESIRVKTYENIFKDIIKVYFRLNVIFLYNLNTFDPDFNLISSKNVYVLPVSDNPLL